MNQAGTNTNLASSISIPASSAVAVLGKDTQIYLLENNSGKFTDVTEKVSPELKTLGMITDAIWSDFDLDGKLDLIVVGEFLPITFFNMLKSF